MNLSINPKSSSGNNHQNPQQTPPAYDTDTELDSSSSSNGSEQYTYINPSPSQSPQRIHMVTLPEGIGEGINIIA